MPNQDGTGPAGKGARTGRGRGDCPTDKPAGQSAGRGFGRGARPSTDSAQK